MNKDQTIKVKLQRVLSLLKAQDRGIRTIQIEFSGSGDSGDIDEVDFLNYEDNSVTLPESIISVEVFTDLAWEIISDKVDSVGDWVNNEGGFGNIIIDVEKKSYDLNYSQRTTEDYDWSDQMMFI